jgi:hypothetical protein
MGFAAHAVFTRLQRGPGTSNEWKQCHEMPKRNTRSRDTQRRQTLNIKFTIPGDFCQLIPVNDRISQYTDYANPPCLFELADYNKVQIPKCRRADDTLYNLI